MGRSILQHAPDSAGAEAYRLLADPAVRAAGRG